MKWLLIVLFPSLIYSQTQPADTCFTQQEIQDISNTLDELYYQDSINNVLITQQKQLIIRYEELIQLDSLQLQYKQEQINLLKENINLYVQREKRLRPKWYNSNALWFGSGILTSILTAFSISQLVN
jgi:hypothetical protein